MKEEIKARWCTALRSGDFEQGKEALHPQGKFCCLGVLTDLYIQDHDNAKWAEPNLLGSQQYFILDGKEKRTDYLNTEVSTWAGLESHNPQTNSAEGDSNSTLASLNDRGVEFDFIADIIEEQL